MQDTPWSGRTFQTFNAVDDDNRAVNEERPHASLGDMPPVEFAARRPGGAPCPPAAPKPPTRSLYSSLALEQGTLHLLTQPAGIQLGPFFADVPVFLAYGAETLLPPLAERLVPTKRASSLVWMVSPPPESMPPATVWEELEEASLLAVPPARSTSTPLPSVPLLMPTLAEASMLPVELVLVLVFLAAV